MAFISPPAALATFLCAHASSSRRPHVTLSPVQGNSKLAVAAVQGDGVWTYDLNTLRPTTSFTVPPSTIFSTVPISYLSSSPSKSVKDKQKASDESMDLDASEVAENFVQPQRTTLIGVQQGGVKVDEEGKTIWLWRGEEGAEKEAIGLDFRVWSIHHLNSPEFPILVVGPKTLALIDSSLNVHSVDAPHIRPPSEILTARILSSSSDTALMVTVDIKGHISVIKINYGGEIALGAEVSKQGPLSGQGKTKSRFVSADISEDGNVTGIDSAHRLYSRNVHDLNTSTSQSWPTLVHPMPHLPVLSLSSPTKPLALIPTSHPTSSLLLAVTSPALPAILTSTSISTLTSAGSFSGIYELAHSSPNVTVVGLVTSNNNADGSGNRSLIYVCEVTTPLNGVGLSMLLGSQERTSKWLNSNDDYLKQEALAIQFENSPTKLIDDLRKSLENTESSQAAEDLFRTWIREEDGKVPGGKLTTLPEYLVKQLLQVVFESALTRRTNSDESSEEAKVSPTGPYASGILRRLIERKMVNDSLWEGGVISSALLPCKDWTNIMLALLRMTTIPPSTSVKLINTVLESNPAPTTVPEAGPNYMPSFSVLLRTIMRTTVPDTTYRVELRKGLSVENATSVLEQLVVWVEKYVEDPSQGLTDWLDPSAKKNKRRSSTEEPAERLPRIEAMIAHSSILLDSHLPLFLSYEPSHSLLARLQTTTEPLLTLQNQLRQLRAPVEAVLTLARREEKRLEELKAKKADERASAASHAGPWGKKPKAKANDSGRGLPQEVVGKWKVEDFVF